MNFSICQHCPPFSCLPHTFRLSLARPLPLLPAATPLHPPPFPLSPSVSVPKTPSSPSLILSPSPSLVPLVETLIHALEKFAKLKIPLLICADLNYVPQSDPYTFISKGRVEILPSKETDKSGILQTVKLSHSLNLVSAYATFFQSHGVEDHQREKMNPETKEPLFTNFTPFFFGNYLL